MVLYILRLGLSAVANLVSDVVDTLHAIDVKSLEYDGYTMWM